MTIGLVLAAGCAIGWLVALDRRSRSASGRSRHVSLVMLPVALLFLTLPVAISAWQLIRGFRDLAGEANAGMGIATVAPLVVAIAQSLWLGGVGLLVTLGVAGALQFRRRHAGPAGDAAETAQATTWHAWVLVSGPLLILPVGLETLVGQRLTAVLMSAVVPGTIVSTTSAQLAEFSGTIAAQSVLAVLLGLTISALLILSAGGGMATINRTAVSARSAQYSLMAVTLAATLAGWNIVSARAALRAFAQAISTAGAPMPALAPPIITDSVDLPGRSVPE